MFALAVQLQVHATSYQLQIINHRLRAGVYKLHITLTIRAGSHDGLYLPARILSVTCIMSWQP